MEKHSDTTGSEWLIAREETTQTLRAVVIYLLRRDGLKRIPKSTMNAMTLARQNMCKDTAILTNCNALKARSRSKPTR